jgi:hypothetical protein
MEMTFDFMASKNSENFLRIIDKHRPVYVSRDNIKWYFDIYNDLSDIDAGDVAWYSSGGSMEAYVELDGINGFTPAAGGIQGFSNHTKPELNISTSGAEELRSLSGKAFVLTVVCDYQFSSAFVQKLFGGRTLGADKFLLWSRSVGVCN